MLGTGEYQRRSDELGTALIERLRAEVPAAAVVRGAGQGPVDRHRAHTRGRAGAGGLRAADARWACSPRTRTRPRCGSLLPLCVTPEDLDWAAERIVTALRRTARTDRRPGRHGHRPDGAARARHGRHAARDVARPARSRAPGARRRGRPRSTIARSTCLPGSRFLNDPRDHGEVRFHDGPWELETVVRDRPVLSFAFPDTPLRGAALVDGRLGASAGYYVNIQSPLRSRATAPSSTRTGSSTCASRRPSTPTSGRTSDELAEAVARGLLTGAEARERAIGPANGRSSTCCVREPPFDRDWSVVAPRPVVGPAATCPTTRALSRDRRLPHHPASSGVGCAPSVPEKGDPSWTTRVASHTPPPPPPPPGGEGGAAGPGLPQRGIGEILEHRVRDLQGERASLLMIVAIVVVPLTFISAFIGGVRLRARDRDRDGPRRVRRDRERSHGRRGDPRRARWPRVIGVIISAVLQAAIMRGAAQGSIGDPVDIDASYKWGFARFGSVILISILVGLAVARRTDPADHPRPDLRRDVLRRDPGPGRREPARHRCDEPVVEPGEGSLLARGRRRSSSRAIITAVVGGIIGAIGGAISDNWFVAWIFQAIAQIITAPFAAIVSVLLYLDLRARREVLTADGASGGAEPRQLARSLARRPRRRPSGRLPRVRATGLSPGDSEPRSVSP